MVDQPRLPDAFDGILAELFWEEVTPRAVAFQEKMLAAGGLRRLTDQEKWLVEGGAIAGAMQAILWLAEHDMVKDYRPVAGDVP